MFKGILIEKDDAGYRAAVKDIDEAQLPEGDVTVRVERSSLNYKDGLAITGKGPVVRKFPMVPGIDIAGTVEASDNPITRPATASCSTAGVSAKRTGAAWRRRRASRATGWCRCRLPSARSRRGHRHRRLHRHAVRAGAGEARRQAGRWRNRRHRCGGRRRQRGDCRAGKLGYTVVAVSGRPEKRIT
jgi:acrylyl-CoA reductase (NADPH)